MSDTESSARLDSRVIVLFGATGDLAKRMLFPALFQLFQRDLMPEDFRIIGSGRHSPGSDEEFRDQMREAMDDEVSEDEDAWGDFIKRLSFVVSSADDGEELAKAVDDAEDEINASGTRLVYLSVPPDAMDSMVDMLQSTGLSDGASLVTEKPFGHDPESAGKLNETLHRALEEDSIYRIDHFLGKEAVLNLLALRLSSGIFEPLWNSDHVAYVQIDIPEDIDIEGRGSFYEETGAFRDMVVNHLLQVLAVVAMEPPAKIGTDEVHAARSAVLEAVEPLDPDRVVFGQYEGYRDEDDVDPDSKRDTFAALEVRVGNERWSGVPFYLRTGKALAADRRSVTLGLRASADSAGDVDGGGDDADRPTEITFELADDPTGEINVRAKVPGPGFAVAPAAFRLDVAKDQDGSPPLDAYARLLHDAMIGDHMLFSTAEQVERLWEICAPVLDAEPTPLPYDKGSWGPDEALELPAAPGWRLPNDEK